MKVMESDITTVMCMWWENLIPLAGLVLRLI